jgi:Sec-independent protein secretion pathway component TatC
MLLIIQLFLVFFPLVPNVSLSTVFSIILTLYRPFNVRHEVPLAAIRLFWLRSVEDNIVAQRFTKFWTIFDIVDFAVVKEDEMGRACSSNGGEEECI